MRQLATLQVIEELTPIEGADRIEEARVMGWSVVVKKGEFQVGDYCMFFEIDSVLPPEEWAAFMQPRRYRVKTVRLRGVLSQGLALPVSILPCFTDTLPGMDLTERLGVTKYEPPVSGDNSQAAGTFISHVPKTDETRCQSVLGILHELEGQPYYITEKVDGTSATYAMVDRELRVCSRNQELLPGSGQYWAMAEKYGIADTLPEGLVLQGEICGPGIQKNRLGLEEVELRIFNIFNRTTQKYLLWDAVLKMCELMGLTTVTELERGASFSYTKDELLELAEGTYPESRKRREGIVIRALEDMESRHLGGKRLSFKMISNSFLLKDED